ncbi:hypothetical protein HSX11_14880 [Oxalobacteraceae bacterium]|nr:hypothetical protein [Oxalobacteraceae bacterium]
MSGQARFRYALEPILLTRQWALDALLLELGEANAQLAECRANCAAAREQLDQAAVQWRALGAGAQALSVDQFMRLARYMDERGAHLRALEQAQALKEQERDALIDQVAAAQRGIDAVERHRKRMQAQFVKARTSGDFKIADDQWGMLQAGLANHDNQI